MSEEMQPIPADEARAALEAAIIARLGDNWDDPDDGWTVITQHDYMARLTRGSINLDFYVDLVGNVTVEEKPINPVQSAGRLVAWLLLFFSLIIAFLIARIAGFL